MKILKSKQFISERMKIVPISNNELNNIKTYNYYPKTREELKSIITKRIEKEGSKCDLNDIDTSKITDMSELFIHSNFNGNISRWDTSNVTNMRCMFYNVESFNQDISQWDVSNVTNMSYMFYNAEKFNQDISKWNTSKVTDMTKMFCFAESFNQDISKWDVSNVIDMTKMFYYAYLFNQDISKWNVSNVTNFDNIFYHCTLNNYPEKQPRFK